MIKFLKNNAKTIAFTAGGMVVGGLLTAICMNMDLPEEAQAALDAMQDSM